MVDNEWVSTLNALRQANKEKDEFVNSLMEDIANFKIEAGVLRLEVDRLRDKYEPVSALYRRLKGE